MATTNPDITSANATIKIISDYSPNGFLVESFAVDQSFDVETLVTKEVQMGTDGKFRSGIIFNEINFNMHLSGGSPTIEKFIEWATIERNQSLSYSANLILVIPNRGVEFNLVDGCLFSVPPTISAAKVLSDFTVQMKFGSFSYSKL